MEDGDIHTHCMDCVKIKKCTIRPQVGVSCKIVSCDLNCGSVFHSCKKKEHQLLCLNEKVPCINAQNGCPFVMTRRNQAKHLSVCPASVIHCTMEWTPWHLDVHRKVKLLYNKTNTGQQQLDVALAKRDLLTFHKWWYVINKDKRKAFPNDFVKYSYPLLVYKVPHTISFQGYNEIIGNDMYNDEDHSLELATVLCESNCMFVEHHVQDENKENINYTNHVKKELKRTSFLEDQNKLPIEYDEDKYNHDEDKLSFEYCVPFIPELPFRLQPTMARLQPTMLAFLCCKEFRRDECSWHYKNVHSEIQAGLHGWLQERCPLAQYGCTFSRQRLNPVPKGSRIVFNEINESFGFRPPESLAQDTNVRTCDKNDVLNCDRERDHSRVQITDLPFEVLLHIAHFLDSFSLSNLSLTSHLMRNVCQNLLKERGIVTLQWEKDKTAAKSKWIVVSKKWFFSSHFSPVRQWNFDDDVSMLNHLKTCTYFNRNFKSDPYYYPMGLEPNYSIYQKLKNSASESPRGVFENITTKL